MKGTATIIDTDGNIKVESFSEPLPLEKLQEYVGGYIEILPLFDNYQGENCIAFCNEEGKLEQLPYNKAATVLWKKTAEPFLKGDELNDYIAGNLVILTGDEEFMRGI